MNNILLILVGALALGCALVFFKRKTNASAGQLSEKAVQGSDPKPAIEIESEVTVAQALKNTRNQIWGRISGVFSSPDSEHREALEEILYTSDIGPQTVELLLETVDQKIKNSDRNNLEALRDALKNEMFEIFNPVFGEAVDLNKPLARLKFAENSPTVWMIVGVNGAGKTTSIGKIAALLAQSGKKVLVAAGDTFRAAAGGQLKVWTDRAQVEIFSPEGVTDPSAVAFDAIAKARAQGYDIVLVDTAGRLHTQSHLMEELKKMKRVVQKHDGQFPHEVLIVLDANSGQNALMQAKEFNAALGLTGVVLTKMDGTAKGGVAIGLTHELKIPIKLIGVGEKIGDLRNFSPEEFINSVF